VITLAEIRRTLAQRITGRLAHVMGRSGLNPNSLTIANLVLSIVAAYVISVGHFITGGVLVLVSGMFDLLDGAVARVTGRTSTFGALLDSVVDRVSEAAVLCGLAIWGYPQAGLLELSLIIAVLAGSFLVSYIRARAEGLGLQCHVGLFTRAERVIVLAIGLLVNQVLIALCVLAFFVTITVIQRLVFVRHQTRTRGD